MLLRRRDGRLRGCDALAGDRTAQEEFRTLGAVIGVGGYGFGYGRPLAEWWSMIRSAWTSAREQGRDAGDALGFVSAVVAGE
ncbi:hypothetical protein [Streptomyces lateritius]|uniref:hypothetical protein n=1 Tax=Streptomyces lateritius TaxID=67313 RepID=UPI00167A0595|nr:hypothetical protein [Streptomyces lateritius]GGU01932.1 hypothetical protein GCM10010272_53820 [Streptomyces lateritius]